jgi:uncharacterized protein YcbK (DUF882 family)
MDRRSFLKSTIAGMTTLSTGLIVPKTAQAYYQTPAVDHQNIARQQEKDFADYQYLINNSVGKNQSFIEQDKGFFNKNERRLWLKRESTGESGYIAYFNKDGYITENYAKICYLLRDVTGQKAGLDKTTVLMNPRLLELLYSMQNFLFTYGYQKPLIIKSGYRTKNTNSNIEGAAKNSMHLYGKAADLVVEGINPIYLGKLAALYQKGGVGFYPNKNFVHVDVGTVRYWKS